MRFEGRSCARCPSTKSWVDLPRSGLVQGEACRLPDYADSERLALAVLPLGA